VRQGSCLAANYIRAAAGQKTGGRPSNVCSGQAITGIEPETLT